MRIPFVLLVTTLASVTTGAWANLTTPDVDGSELSWSSLTASTINIHRGDGSYVESLPGSATSWTAPEAGEYYLVAADEGDWRDWPRSDAVTVQDGSTSGAPMPFVNFIELAWPAVSALSINVHQGDGTFIESLAGDATNWQPEQFGDYFLVATNDGLWQNWPRSETITISNPGAPEDVITGLRSDVYSQTAAEVFWDRLPGSGISYRVSKGAESVTETNGTSWFSDDFTAGSTTIIRVQAIYADGTESASRSVPIITPGEAQALPFPTISRDNHEALLAEVLGLYFGRQYREQLSDLANNTMSELRSLVNQDFSASNPYACINGGEALFEGPFTIEFDDCRIDDAVYHGNFNVHEYYGDTDRVSSSGMTITSDLNTEFQFSGSLDGAIHPTPGFYSAVDMNISVITPDSELQLQNANLEYTFAHLMHSTPFLNTSFSGSFDLRSQITNNELIHVNTPSSFNHNQLLSDSTDWNYSSGILNISAEDGSQLILNAGTGDDDTVNIQLVNGTEVEEFQQSWLPEWTVWQHVLGR
ncbi:hypothetical protein [Granulosicoccus antarcticus]|uniref:Fibronectin type-III domain-containing protein n=1 Tax=Granulosicoccus antarcticus IMCC3135 TaxID=1192854 RepID=A0A2Z2P056_9GAMM|nr:hypothetical protein [Granulosicoccus antarcticus]ASJ72774.1 hypothetical protein IMCC3135_13445 [Granulosicoccus antarcticus IMCC3135]